MFDEGRSCLELAQQIQAVESVVHSAKRSLIQDHMEHCLGDAGFLLVQHPRPPAPASALSSRREAGLGVFDDQLTLKFIEGGCDMEK